MIEIYWLMLVFDCLLLVDMKFEEVVWCFFVCFDERKGWLMFFVVSVLCCWVIKVFWIDVCEVKWCGLGVSLLWFWYILLCFWLLLGFRIYRVCGRSFREWWWKFLMKCLSVCCECVIWIFIIVFGMFSFFFVFFLD